MCLNVINISNYPLVCFHQDLQIVRISVPDEVHEVEGQPRVHARPTRNLSDLQENGNSMEDGIDDLESSPDDEMKESSMKTYSILFAPISSRIHTSEFFLIEKRKVSSNYRI